ncbi:MAG: DUF4158 domain-containing protein [Candidatus Nanopelagicales bacterium]|nr:DUF4158 domain-containing protein [Candidatus Nanopelagicales bacterium]
MGGRSCIDMAPALDLDELVEYFTLHPDEHDQLRNKTGATRLGFALVLKHVLWQARFPVGISDLPDNAIEFVARQVGVPGTEMGSYDWNSRQSKRHRTEIREATGFRPCSVADADTLTAWLSEGIARTDRNPDLVREHLLARCRDDKIEPPTPERIGRIVGPALHRAEQRQHIEVRDRIPSAVAGRILALIEHLGAEDEVAEGSDESALATIRSDPGNVSLKTTTEEVDKLKAVRAIGLPPQVFADVAPKIVNAWRARAAVEAPSHLRLHPEQTTLSLLAALLYCRERELTDTLVDLLIATVQRINARADKKVVDLFVSDLKKVSGKENILYKITEAVLEEPDGIVRDVVYPAVGGMDTLTDLLHEYKAKGSTFRQHKQRVFKASYTNHYRRGMIDLISALEFRSTNTTHRPVLDALELIKR